MNKTLYIFILILFSIIGCDKADEFDYRKPYIGEFDFSTVVKVHKMCYDTSETCIVGWTEYIENSFSVISNIEYVDSNKLSIPFGNDILWIRNAGYNDSDTVYQTINCTLLTDGTLDLPDPENYNLRWFEGNYIGHDTIKMNFHYGIGGMGGYRIYNVIGTRKK